ncbi:MAG TPA: homoserine O-succinyltransferase, partial [Candidatus Aminicenantes bacterium]|nr:homoserine O-succinyltransferase [Candidatus Aminicenantes bacterium]
EYPTRRLAEEYFRDRTRGRADVPRPAGYDPDRPVNSWEADGVAFFRGWLGALQRITGERGEGGGENRPL